MHRQTGWLVGLLAAISEIAVAQKSPKQSKQDEPAQELERVLRNFVACDRCSFFLAGYRVIHGLDNLEAAAKNQSDRWLALSWNSETRHLLQKSYGGQLDVELYYYDSHCPACRRRFIYEAGEEEEGGETAASFRIEVKQ